MHSRRVAPGRGPLPVTVSLAVLLAAPVLHAQTDDAVLRPGDELVNPAAIRPFRAEYEQLGTPFWFDLRRADGDRPVYSAIMTMHSFLGGLAVDHAGFYADDLGFAHRQTTFGRWGVEYLDVREQEGSIRMARMSLDPEGRADRRWFTATLDGPVFEGTLVYWLLAALPLRSGFVARLPTLAWTETGFEERLAEFRVVGRETIEAGGESYDCYVVATGNDAVELRNYVARRAPYLVRQVAVQDGSEQTVIDLRAVERWPAPPPGSGRSPD